MSRTDNLKIWRDDFYQSKIADEIDRDQNRLTQLRVRYEDSARSRRERHPRYRKPYYFSSGSNSSLVVP